MKAIVQQSYLSCSFKIEKHFQWKYKQTIKPEYRRMPKRLLLKTHAWNQKTANEKLRTVTVKTSSLAGRENAKWGWREIQQDLKRVLHPVVILKTLKENIWNFILLNCWWEVSFVNAVPSLLLSEGLGSESVHRKEIHTLFPVNDGNTGAASQHCCKSKHLQRRLWSYTSLYELKTWPRLSNQLSGCVGIHFGLLFLLVFVFSSA